MYCKQYCCFHSYVNTLLLNAVYLKFNVFFYQSFSAKVTFHFSSLCRFLSRKALQKILAILNLFFKMAKGGDKTAPKAGQPKSKDSSSRDTFVYFATAYKALKPLEAYDGDDLVEKAKARTAHEFLYVCNIFINLLFCLRITSQAW